MSMHKQKLALCVVCVLWCGGESSHAAEDVYASQRSFRIPFRVDAAQMARLGAREVQLYASRDGGQNWQYVQSVPPEASYFDFCAPADGQYWFAVKTRDGDGQLHPPGEFQAGLKVVVATQSASVGDQTKVRVPLSVPPGGDHPGPGTQDQGRINGGGNGDFQPQSGKVGGAESNADRPAQNFEGSLRSIPVAQPPVRFVNSDSFQIGYALDGGDATGVRSVELFITEDDGRKWWRYGEDADRQSPMEVRVPREGRYGFALRALPVVTHAGTATLPDRKEIPVTTPWGLASRSIPTTHPPQPGDPPEIVVVVDCKPPRVERFAPVLQAVGGSARLLLQWSVWDEHPAEQPIALSYSADPRGPWVPIGDWQADRGSEAWEMGPEVPGRIYVRLTARDAAGNLGEAQTPTPIVVGKPLPAARIVNVQAPPR